MTFTKKPIKISSQRMKCSEINISDLDSNNDFDLDSNNLRGRLVKFVGTETMTNINQKMMRKKNYEKMMKKEDVAERLV